MPRWLAYPFLRALPRRAVTRLATSCACRLGGALPAIASRSAVIAFCTYTAQARTLKIQARGARSGLEGGAGRADIAVMGLRTSISV